MFSENRNIPQYETVKTFLDGLFDYAGLFPPASLSLSDALEEYSWYRATPDAWMLGPFVLPIAELEGLSEHASLFDKTDAFRFSLLFRSADRFESLMASFEEDLQATGQFLRRFEGGVSVEMVELRLPEASVSTAESATAMVSALSARIAASSTNLQKLYLEIRRGHAFSAAIKHVSRSISECQNNPASKRSSQSPVLGLKIRCGGIREIDYPSAVELAQFIKTVCDWNVPFKATAGLHHPIRHFNQDAGVIMHGFLNVFFAATLAAANELGVEDLTAIILDEEKESFEFSKEGIRWRGISASSSELKSTRKSLACSIGSCSFDEPRADLCDLNWLRADVQSNL